MSVDPPTYFLLKYSHGRAGYTAYAKGSNIFNIFEFHKYRITRFYPYPPVDITRHLATLQRLWRLRLSQRRWCSHPRRLQYRCLRGRFPHPFPNIPYLNRQREPGDGTDHSAEPRQLPSRILHTLDIPQRPTTGGFARPSL